MGGTPSASKVEFRNRIAMDKDLHLALFSRDGFRMFHRIRFGKDMTLRFVPKQHHPITTIAYTVDKKSDITIYRICDVGQITGHFLYYVDGSSVLAVIKGDSFKCTVPERIHKFHCSMTYTSPEERSKAA